MSQPNRVGDVLRAAREQRGLTVSEAAQQASVPVQYVRLLEGEKNVTVGVADELYLVPFLRRYATFLNLDPAELLPEFLGYLHLTSDVQPPAHLTYRSRVKGLWRPALVAVAVAGATIVMIHRSPRQPLLDDVSSSEPTAIPNDPASGAVVPTPFTSHPDVASPEANRGIPPTVNQAPETVTPVSAAPTPSEARPVSHELRVVVHETAWIMLEIDNRPKESFLLHPGESRTFTAAESFLLTLGNAGGVSVFLDGSELPPLGRSGDVARNVRLPRPLPSPGG